MLFAITCFGQAGINSFTSVLVSPSSGTTYASPGAGVGATQAEYMPSSNNTFTYKFGSTSGYAVSSRSVNGYMAGNSSFSVIANVVTGVVMRRVNNSHVSGNRDILFFAGNRTPGINTTGQTNSSLTLNLNAGYVPDMGTAFSQNNLLIGTDNIFSNQGNGNDNNNNIERVDVMIGGGYTILNAQKYGFPILERGIYGAHDAFKIAVITAVDALGNPTAYSNVVSATSTDYNNTSSANPVTDGSYNYFLFKRNSTSNLEVDQHITDQGIGGVAFRFSDFGIASGTKIYGYSIMANDFNSTLGADVVDYTNSTRFSTHTSETTGGLDILAVLGIAMETTILPVELSSFTAFAKGDKTILQWSTVTEMNNRGFQVERSANGQDWTVIGFADTKATGGNSTDKLQYSFIDNNPVKGNNYYRLRQFDIDNKEKISSIRLASIGQTSEVSIKVFPNPVANEMHIEGLQAGTTCRLVDLRGSVISRFTANASTQTISTEKLIPGIYFLQVITNNAAAKTIQLVKM
jgi:hypothetical protein